MNEFSHLGVPFIFINHTGQKIGVVFGATPLDNAPRPPLPSASNTGGNHVHQAPLVA